MRKNDLISKNFPLPGKNFYPTLISIDFSKSHLCDFLDGSGHISMTRNTAILVMVIAMTAAAIDAAIIKFLTVKLSLIQLLFYNYALMMLFILPGQRLNTLKAQLPLWPKHLGRFTMMILGASCFYAALPYTELTAALSLFYTYPIATLIVAWFIFSAAITQRDVAAILVGLLGVLLILGPSGTSPATFLILITVFCVAGRGAFDRALSLRGARPRLIQAISNALAVLFLLIIAPLTSQTLSPWAISGDDWVLLLIMAGLAYITQLSVISVIASGHWTIYAAFGYWEVLASIPVAYITFQEFPNKFGLIGVVLIIGAGIVVSLNNKPVVQDQS